MTSFSIRSYPAITCLLLLVNLPTPSFGQFVVAHRGASFDAPENTLAAFRLAWEQGADAIEGDFYLTADNEIVCLHDKTTKRVSPDQTEIDIARSTLTQLRQLDVGRWKNEQFAGQRIPTLSEVLDTVPPRKKVFVEIKCGPQIVPVLKRQLAASGFDADQIIIISFNEDVVRECRHEMPQYKCNWLTGFKQKDGSSVWKPKSSEVIETLRQTGATGLGANANEEVIDRVFADQVHEAGFEFHVWTVNDLAATQRFVELGVDSITTDRPAVIRNALPTKNTVEHDTLGDLQEHAITQGRSPAAHWGWRPDTYSLWTTHSNRLIPVYTYGTKDAGKGIDLNDYQGKNSLYRDEARVTRLYGRLTTNTINPEADYLDQTNVFDLQRAALEAGKKHIFLVVFDGMDWQTTRATAINNQQRISYESGRGTGTHFQEYMAGGTSQFGFMVTSPHNDGTRVDVNSQTVKNPGGTVAGGYDVSRGGPNPWTVGNDPQYLVTEPKNADDRHAYTDSASSAVSMTAGVKTYNAAINLTASGELVSTIAHMAQAEGYSIGAVTSVPISHATPAAAYAHNVHRNDYQDLTRDLIGRPSINHPERPLSGLDVLIGGGYGTDRDKDSGQGKNFVPGNPYLTADDMKAADVRHGGKYVVAVRTEGVSGAKRLAEAAQEARESSHRLLGFYGVGSAKGHLPYQTADGKFDPVISRQKTAEKYTASDLSENPTLADMTRAALTVLESNPKGFWLMMEPGDVDWANHDNNLDNAIGAVNSGDAAVKVITDWVEQNSNWQESVMIVTADHGHYMFLDRPELLIRNEQASVPSELPHEIQCAGTYQHHLQGIDADHDSVFWSFTTALVKTDLDGNVVKSIPVANHHGDLCCFEGRLYVAVNLGKFNDPQGNADSWVYVYDATTLEEIARHETDEVFYGAGGIGYRDGSFFVVGGLPDGIDENYVYEYDSDFEFVRRHVIKSGHTHLGIQTAAYAHGRWWFGCYGTPPTLLVTDENFELQGRHPFNCSLGIAGVGGGRLLTGRGSCDADRGCTGRAQTVVPDQGEGLKLSHPTN